MANCVIRVELHNARSSEVYDRLHQKLSAHGIVNTIVANDGKRYRLPPAEYYYTGGASRDAVLQTSQQCAAAIDNSYAVLVSDTNSVTWSGLQQV
jgi:hypothetical protein